MNTGGNNETRDRTGRDVLQNEESRTSQELVPETSRYRTDKHRGHFLRRDHGSPDRECLSARSPFSDATTYFGPGEKEFMFEYRVVNLRALPGVLKMGVTVVGEVEE